MYFHLNKGLTLKYNNETDKIDNQRFISFNYFTLT